MTGKEGLLFGTAGIPLSSKAPSTQTGIERIHELGLGCIDVELPRALTDYRVRGLLICQSPNREQDALLLQQTYRAL